MCARAPSLTWVRGRVSGDKMIDGVTQCVAPVGKVAAARSMEAVQGLGGGGGSIAGAGRKGIGLIMGARTTVESDGRLGVRCPGGIGRGECVVAEFAQDVVGAAAEFACDREAGAVVVKPVGDLEVVGVVG